MTHNDTQHDSTKLSYGHLEDGSTILNITPENSEPATFVIGPSQLPGVLHTMSGGMRDDATMASARIEADLFDTGQRTKADLVNHAQTLLLALALLEEREAEQAGEIVDAEILDDIDDMSRDEAIALAKDLRNATSPYEMARWATANPDLVKRLTAEPEPAEIPEYTSGECGTCGQ